MEVIDTPEGWTKYVDKRDPDRVAYLHEIEEELNETYAAKLQADIAKLYKGGSKIAVMRFFDGIPGEIKSEGYGIVNFGSTDRWDTYPMAYSLAPTQPKPLLVIIKSKTIDCVTHKPVADQFLVTNWPKFQTAYNYEQQFVPDPIAVNYSK
jgi:hypothetical protein